MVDFEAIVTEVRQAEADYHLEIMKLEQSMNVAPTLFKVRDATQFDNRPDLSLHGLKRIRFVNASEFWPSGADRSLPDLEYIENSLIPRLAATGFTEFVFDIEHWKLHEDFTLQRHHLAVLNVFRRLRPRWKCSFYGEVPIRSLNHLRTDVENRTAIWRAKNDALAPLVNAVDEIFASCYWKMGSTTVTNPVLQAEFFRSMCEEARRIAPRKVINAVVWIEWDSVHTLYNYDEMKRALQLAWQWADNIVLWSMAGGTSTFYATDLWFTAVSEFIKEKRITKW